MPAFLGRVREVKVALFVEVTEGGADSPLHWAEQVSVQDKEYPWLTGMFASPILNCLDTQLTRWQVRKPNL